MARNDVSGKDLAEAIGISKAALSLKMKGEREFKRSEMWKIRKILAPHLTIEELFESPADDRLGLR